jgi:hypothetical protein
MPDALERASPLWDQTLRLLDEGNLKIPGLPDGPDLPGQNRKP